MRFDIQAAGTPPDLSGLLLGRDARVTGDDDFVFWNMPEHPSGSVTLNQYLNVEPSKLPTWVQTVLVLVSTFETSAEAQVSLPGQTHAVQPMGEGEAIVAVSLSRGLDWRAVPGDGAVRTLVDILTDAGVQTLEEEPDGDNGPVLAVEASDPVTPEAASNEPPKRGRRSRRIKRGQDASRVLTQSTKELSADESSLLAILPTDATTMTRLSVLSALGEQWTSRRFYAARDLLVERGLIVSVRGRGGGLQRVTVEESATDAASVRYANEASLYPPMRRVLEKEWAEDHGFEPIKVEITASQGSRATGGTWSRPDMVLTQIRLFDYLPGKYVEVITFEIKPRTAVNVLAVYEAVSHRRAATRSYVIFHIPSAETATLKELLVGIEDVARKHGVGLIVAGDPSDYSTWEDRVDAEHWEPDPGRLNLFIKTQLSEDTRQRIVRDIR